MKKSKRVLCVVLGGVALGATVFATMGCGGGSCAAGATKESSTGVCMAIPAGAKFSELKKAGSDGGGYFNVDKLFGLTVWLDKSEPLDAKAKIVANMAGSELKLVESGDTPSKGKFYHFHNTARNTDFAVTLVPGAKYLYRCEIQNANPADVKPMLDACKSMTVP